MGSQRRRRMGAGRRRVEPRRLVEETDEETDEGANANRLSYASAHGADRLSYARAHGEYPTERSDRSDEVMRRSYDVYLTLRLTLTFRVYVLVFPQMSPTLSPSLGPTLAPTLSPSLGPTLTPTLSPTLAPTLSPSLSPTLAPTLSPSLGPTVSSRSRSHMHLMYHNPAQPSPNSTSSSLSADAHDAAYPVADAFSVTEPYVGTDNVSIPGPDGKFEVPWCKICDCPHAGVQLTIGFSFALQLTPTMRPTLAPTLTPSLGPTVRLRCMKNWRACWTHVCL